MNTSTRLETPHTHFPIASHEQFQRDGYSVVKGMADPTLCKRMRQEIQASLNPLQGPTEFEADIGYPGAPETRDAPGGNTSRRLLHAYSRNELFRAWALNPTIKHHLAELMGTSDILLSQCHHNCIMTKHPGYSSATHWHQDIRYWAFDRPELVTVWLALTDEHRDNGALSVIPGSHRIDLKEKQLNEARFLRTDLEQNRDLLEQAKLVKLQAGDVLFFHSRLLHAADMNSTKEMKASLVFTYHASDNHPTPDTRSSMYPSITL